MIEEHALKKIAKTQSCPCSPPAMDSDMAAPPQHQPGTKPLGWGGGGGGIKCRPVATEDPLMDEAEAHADLSAERGEATPLLEDSGDELRPPVGNRHRGEFSRVPQRHNTDNSTVEPVLPTSSMPRPTRQTRTVATQAAELPPRLKKREPAACLLELSLFPSPPRQAGRRREADEDEANLHSAPRTCTGAEKLPQPLPPHLTNTSTSLSRHQGRLEGRMKLQSQSQRRSNRRSRLY
jgi:hypothetical protein